MDGLPALEYVSELVARIEVESVAGFKDGKDDGDLRARRLMSQVYPVSSTDGDSPPGVLEMVVTEFQLRMLEEGSEFVPAREV